MASAPPTAAMNTPKRYTCVSPFRRWVGSAQYGRPARRRRDDARCRAERRRDADGRRLDERESRQLRGEPRESPAHPESDVTGGCNARRSDERETCLERQEVAMHRADEAVETVPAEPGTPVEIGLEQAAGEARRQRQPEREPARAR